MVGKARIFSDSSREAVYQKEFDDEIYSAATQQNSYNLGSVHFSDNSGIANITQAGTDQRKANLKGALFTGNIGFDLQTAVLDVPTSTINLLEDATSTELSVVSTDKIVNISAGSTADLTTILGAQRPGQRLTLYNIDGNTITIKNTIPATENTILTPDGLDFTFENSMAINLVYDITTTKWRIVGSTGGGGGLTEPIILTVNEITPQTLPTTSVIDWSLNPNHIDLDRAVEFEFSNLPTAGKYEGVLVIIDIDGIGGFASPIWPASVTNPPVLVTTANTRYSVMLYTINGGTVVTNATSVGSSSGGNAALWANFPAINDVDMDTFDMFDLDRLIFAQDSGVFNSSSDTGFVSSVGGDLLANVPTGTSHFWKIQNIDHMSINGNTDTILSLIAPDNGTIPKIQLFALDGSPTINTQIGMLDYIAKNSNADNIVYGSVRTELEDPTLGSEDGGLSLYARRAGTITAFMTINEDGDNKITAWRNLTFDTGINIEMNSNRIYSTTTANDTFIDGDSLSFQFFIDDTSAKATFATTRLLLANDYYLQTQVVEHRDVVADPTVIDGSIWYNSTAQKLRGREGGATFDLSSGAAITNQISQGDSNVTVTDVGTGVVSTTVDGSARYTIQATRADYVNLDLYGINRLSLRDEAGAEERAAFIANTDNIRMTFEDANDRFFININSVDTATFGPLNLVLNSGTPNTLSAALRLYRNDPSPLASDALGSIHFDGENDNDEFINYATWIGGIESPVDGSETGSMVLNLISPSGPKQILEILPTKFAVRDAFIELDELTATPSNPTANFGLIYLKDDGGTTTPYFLDSAGTETSMIGAGGAGANTALSNLTNPTSINQDLLPDSAGVRNLGSDALRWGNCFFGRIVWPVSTSPIAGDVNIVNNNSDMKFNVSTGNTFLWVFQGGSTQMELSSTELSLPGVNLDMENNNITDTDQIQLTGSTGDTVRGFFSVSAGFLDIAEDENSGVIRMFAKTGGGASNDMVNIDGGSGIVGFGQGSIGFGSTSNRPTISRVSNDLQINTVAASSIILQSGATDRVNLTGTDFNILTGTFVDWQESVSSANTGASTLPANPTGFIKVKVSGVERRIPFYAV